MTCPWRDAGVRHRAILGDAEAGLIWSQVTELASGQINGYDTITVELIEADETPAVVIIRWPDKPSVLKQSE